MHSVEALVRWRHPTRGLLLPDQFLPAAEDAGLMRPLAARVIDMALTQLRSWRDEGVMLTVAVNLSTTNLLDLGLVASIARLLRTHDLPPESLIPEITESTLTTDSQRARNTVAALRRLGTRLSLDDYGTGWSSLARLQDLSVDEMKLDQVFVARLALDPRSIAIVRSTVALAHSLGADLVAEGCRRRRHPARVAQVRLQNHTGQRAQSSPSPRGNSEVAHGALLHAEMIR